MTTGETQQPGGGDSKQAGLDIDTYSPPADVGEQTIQGRLVASAVLDALVAMRSKNWQDTTPEAQQYAQSEEFIGASPEEREAAISRMHADVRRPQPIEVEFARNYKRACREFLDTKFSA